MDGLIFRAIAADNIGHFFHFKIRVTEVRQYPVLAGSYFLSTKNYFRLIWGTSNFAM